MATYTNFNQVKRGGGGVSPAPALYTKRGGGDERTDKRGRLERRAAGGGERSRHECQRNATSASKHCGRIDKYQLRENLLYDLAGSGERQFGCVQHGCPKFRRYKLDEKKLRIGCNFFLHRLCLTEASA